VKSVELFTGAGGLAIGTAIAGFHHLALVERDKHSCHTLRENQERGVSVVKDWCVHQLDVADFDFSTIDGEIDLLAGGPPCQPFSIGGRHGASKDSRDMFPQFFQAVRALRPKAFLIENVRGLLRQNFATYFEYVTLQLAHPEIQPKSLESWVEHLKRLERHHNSGACDELSYQVTFRLLNAADYGVPLSSGTGFYSGFSFG
jgi:DNA (cytosine-5)-methyltransferase 1